jgi:hypothetical protein
MVQVMNLGGRLALAGLMAAAAALGLNCGSDAPATTDAGTPTGDSGGGTDAGNEATTTDAAEDGGSDATPPDAGPECNAATPCSGTLTCCNSHCVDTTKNPSHCGGCGIACTAGTQFCNGVACKETVLTNLCQTPKATVIQDGITEDDTAGTAMATALGTCTPTVTVRTVLQATVEGNTTLNIIATGGRPLLGPGDMLVTAGGSFGQHAVDWLETKSSTPIVSSQTGTTITFTKRSNGQILKTLQESELTTSHDYAIVELTVEPSNGTLTLSAQGLLAPGTRAAAFYMSQVIAPNPATYDQAYYLYEWTDADADFMPDANEFVLVSSGR